MMTMPESIDAGAAVLVRWRGALVSGHAAAFVESERALRLWMPSAAAEQQDSAAFVNACIDAFEQGVTFAYAVIRSEEVIGYCNVTPDGDSAEIAYWIRSDLTGHGLASTVARALVGAAFAALPAVGRVEAHVDQANVASRRVALRAGMTLICSRSRKPRTSAESPTELVFAVARPAH
jgi:RimJ/RimL family protein N-acetyltransferase